MAGWTVPLGQILAQGGIQAVAVGLGVFLGWWINGLSKRKERLAEARARWAASIQGVGAAAIALASATDDVLVQSRVNMARHLDDAVRDRSKRYEELLSARDNARTAAIALTLLSEKNWMMVEDITTVATSFDWKPSTEIVRKRSRSVQEAVDRVLDGWSNGRRRQALKLADSTLNNEEIDTREHEGQIEPVAPSATTAKAGTEKG